MKLVKLSTSNEYALQLKTEKDERHHQFTFDVRQDGCVHVARHDSMIKDDGREYLHLCKLKEFIVLLVEVRTMAKEYFGSDWQ